MSNGLIVAGKTPFPVYAQIDSAKKVYLFVHGDYSDDLIPPQVKVSKAEARRIVAQSYENHPPRWKWNGDSLLIFPRYMSV